MATEHLFDATVMWSGAAQGPALKFDTYRREFTVEMAGKSARRGSAEAAYCGDVSLHNP
jgi:hypothetical protein